MTVATVTPEVGVADGVVSRLRWAITDAGTVTRRNLIAYVRIPESLFFSTVQPIMFVLLFRYIFGGVIGFFTEKAGLSYVNYLMPGIFVQTMMFGSIATAIGLAEDLQKGLIERFRALPMARSAVLAGRTSADFVRNVFVAVVITAVGYAVGFRVQTNFALFLAGMGIILLFAYALSWGFAVVGLSAPNSETAQVMAFPILFPLVFASSAFVPVRTMPTWLQGFATHQPVSVVINAARALMLGPKAAAFVHSTTADLTVTALAWCAGLLAALTPLAIWRYRSRV
ncbi:MAG TPA: ABC transporter permease [Acidimicrobiales bacterium]|nr:ABC transporter permease [Acidimicrobiales bacterium]